MNRSIGGALPRRVTVTLDWGAAENRCNRRAGHITIGLGRPGAAAGGKDGIFHAIARDMARLGLLNISEGAAREDTEFLFEGMIEILVHEFDLSSRSLESAWAIAKLLDAGEGLGLARQRSWTDFSGGVRNHRNAAPGSLSQDLPRPAGAHAPGQVFRGAQAQPAESAGDSFQGIRGRAERVWSSGCAITGSRRRFLVDEARALPGPDRVGRGEPAWSSRIPTVTLARGRVRARRGTGGVPGAEEKENHTLVYTVPPGRDGSVTIVAVDEAGTW